MTDTERIAELEAALREIAKPITTTRRGVTDYIAAFQRHRNIAREALEPAPKETEEP